MVGKVRESLEVWDILRRNILSSRRLDLFEVVAENEGISQDELAKRVGFVKCSGVNNDKGFNIVWFD